MCGLNNIGIQDCKLSWADAAWELAIFRKKGGGFVTALNLLAFGPGTTSTLSLLEYNPSKQNWNNVTALLLPAEVLSGKILRRIKKDLPEEIVNDFEWRISQRPWFYALPHYGTTIAVKLWNSRGEEPLKLFDLSWNARRFSLPWANRGRSVRGQ